MLRSDECRSKGIHHWRERSINKKWTSGETETPRIRKIERSGGVRRREDDSNAEIMYKNTVLYKD
jgi:hypothetical protein